MAAVYPRSEFARRTRHLRFSTVTQSARDAIISTDADGKFSFWNRGVQAILGYIEQEALGRPITMLIAESDRGANKVKGVSMATKQTKWHLRGTGYEFCNCDFGCGCNFGGFPNSKDGSCRALVGMQIKDGVCGDVKLDGLRCAAILDWPTAIHEGNGKCVFVVEPGITDEQIGALSQIFTGKLGGMPWEILGTTYEVVGLEKATITMSGEGANSALRVDGIAEARGAAFKNPVTGEAHRAIVDLPNGFIWSRGECGSGTFTAKAGALNLSFDKTNWILYEFDWSNAAAAAA